MPLLAVLGGYLELMGWRWYNGFGEEKANSKNTITQTKFLQLFEHVGEALPQFILAVVFYYNNYDYIASTEFGFEVFGFLVTQTLISIILSGVSIIKGIVAGIKSCCKLKAWKASEEA